MFNEDAGTPIFNVHLSNEYLGYFAPNNTDMFDLINVTDYNTGYDMVRNAKGKILLILGELLNKSIFSLGFLALWSRFFNGFIE